jgi:guanosine-3',5'-bis(diphosphate) 3'-pyrophosphohydrolase
MPTSPQRILRAVAFAADRHRFQRRKDEEASPYINHPIEVAEVLASEAAVDDETTLIAALLHDTVEDTETTIEEIRELFGPIVAGVVAEVTDDTTLPRNERRRIQLERAGAASREAKLVKIADKICNIRDVAARPPSGWSRERRREYVLWAASVARECAGIVPRLDILAEQQLATTLARIDAMP